MERYSRADLLEATGARPDELEDIEALGILVPLRQRHLFRRPDEYFTADQCEVLRQIIRTRRTIEHHRTTVARSPWLDQGRRSSANLDPARPRRLE